MIAGTKWIKEGTPVAPPEQPPPPPPPKPRSSPMARKLDAMAAQVADLEEALLQRQLEENLKAARREEALAARIAELEQALLQRELDESSQALSARVKRLDRDVATYREARAAAEFIVTDLRTALDHAEESLDRLKVSPAYRLGALLMETGGNWREIARLPSSLRKWARDNRRYQEEAWAELIPFGSATDYTGPIERALELAEKYGLQEAERQVIDQRYPAQVKARVFSELAALARLREPQEAIRLAGAALEADPNESRIKRLAFLMADTGSVTESAQMLRLSIEHGATFNATEDARATDILALADLASTGPVLIPRQASAAPAPPTSQKILVFAPQAYPFHWTSASIRAHAMALALTEAGVAAEVVTPPGYPNVGRKTPLDTPPSRVVDGVRYHILPAAGTAPGFGQDYLAEASKLILALMKAVGATILVAPSDLGHGYPAAMASQAANAPLVFDCFSASLGDASGCTERAQVLSRVEAQLLPYAQLVLARTPSIAAHLAQVAPDVSVRLLPDATPPGAAAKPRAADGAFVFGYVGDNAPDIDIEGLGDLLKRLVDAEVDARLVIYSVGGRIQAIRSQLELQGLGERVRVVEKSPPGRRLAAAFGDLDVVVVPCRPSDDVTRSPFQILSALRHHKCVLALGAAEHDALFGQALLQARDTDAAVQILSELAKDEPRRRNQEAEARAWDEAHPSGSLLAQTLAAL